MTYELIAACVFAVCALVFSVTKQTDNRILLGLCVLFPIAMIAGGKSWGDFPAHLIVGTIALVAGIVYFTLKDGIGGGVVKSAAVIALWLPTSLLYQVFITAALIGGVFALLTYVSRPVGEFGLARFAAMLFGVGAFILFSPELLPRLMLTL